MKASRAAHAGLNLSPKPEAGEQPILPVAEPLLRNYARRLRDSAAGLLTPIVTRSEWRRRRLLILGYHGISLEDEHEWDGGIYMSAEFFRRRLNILQQSRCAVLPLEAALPRLYTGTLPERAVSIVFDDGFHDFASVAAPLLANFGYSATVFVSSYYAQFNRPIFDIMLSYLLWKGQRQPIALPGIFDQPVYLNSAGRKYVYEFVRAVALERGFTGQAKDELLARIADSLGIDYEDLCRKRLLHMMNAREVRNIQSLGHNVQLHTHRHRVSRKKDLLVREIRDNRTWIRQAIGGVTPELFSYPGGVWQPVEREWLTELRIRAAITCRPALADAACDRLLLPRVVDNSHTSESHFRAWLSGSMHLLPKGAEIQTPGQILEEAYPAPY